MRMVTGRKTLIGSYCQVCLILVLFCTVLSFAFHIQSRTVPYRSHERQEDNKHRQQQQKQWTCCFATYQSSIPGDRRSNRVVSETQQAEEMVSLYEILGIAPTASPQEIKKAYFQRAKQTHPDALRDKDSSTKGDTGVLTTDLEFSDVAAAYEILSDPKEKKRYDRALQAQAFSQDVQKLTTELVEQAYPSIYNMMETFAVPFLRRTAATTIAAATKFANSTATASGSNNAVGEKESTDWKSAFKEAVLAARRAGKLVDGIELLEKYDDLEARARKSVNQAYKIKEQLDSISRKRMNMILHAPNATMTSTDAAALLNQWGMTDEDANQLSLFDREMWCRSIRQDINDLQETEQILLQKNIEARQAEAELSAVQKGHAKAKIEMDMAIRAEVAAKEALEAAQLRLKQSQARVETTASDLSGAEVTAKKSFQERDRSFKQITRKQEQVRAALLRKQESLIQQQQRPRRRRGGQLSSTNKAADAADWEDIKDFVGQEIPTSEIKKIKEEESVLSREYSRLADKAATLLKRAHKLKERAEELEKNM